MNEQAPKKGPEGWILVGLAIAALLATVFFIAAPGVDLAVSGWFFDSQAGRFTLARHPIPLFFNDFIEWIAIVLAVFAIFGLSYTMIRKRNWAGLGARAYAFLFMSLLMGPALIANGIFKENWGRARPRQITEFGGSLDFTPAMVLSDQCPGNCSFVSGDASMGFAVLAMALIMPPLWGIGRRVWIAVAVLFGAFIGGVRIVQGAHFFSDVIFAGIFVSAAILALKLIILDRRWGLADLMERGLGRLARPIASGFRITHDEEAKAWRAAQFTRLDTGGWKRAFWVFFSSRPKDFELAEPETEKGREPRPSEITHENA